MSTLSRGSRPIGPIYNDANREARKLKRQGYDKAAEELAFTASKQRLAGGGSNISSAEGNRDERDALERTQRGVMRGERASILKPEAGSPSGLTSAATGDQLTKRQGLYERMRSGVTPEMRKEATGLGITDSGFAQASASAGKNPLKAVGAATPAPTLTAGVSEPSRPTLSRPAAPAAAPAPVREGRINGMPASQALTEVEKPAAFGKEYANANIAKMGLSGAVADYHRRSAEGAKPAEPGNLAELKARDAGATTTAQGVIGPLQQALNASKIRRDGYAADSAAAGKITAGLNSAPTPKLDTTFPVATAPTLSRPAPTAPTLSRPAPTLSNTESTLSRDIRRKAEGEESLAKRRKVISDAHKAKADKIPSPFPSLGDDSGINRIFRSIVASNTK